MEEKSRGENSPSCEVVQSLELMRLKPDIDFSLLPETVWVQVFGYLSLEDRYRLSCTCHTMYEMFNHPSNWKTACIYLMMVPGGSAFSVGYSVMPQKFRQIVNKFGRYIQHLTVFLDGHLVSIEREVKEMFIYMSQVCRLEQLVLEVGIMTSDFSLWEERPYKNDIKVILSLIDTAVRLKGISIISWPMFPEIVNDPEVNIFTVLMRNQKLKSLQSLSLFGMKNKQWSQRIPILPSTTNTVSLVSHFDKLQHLTLRSPMLSEQLLYALASPSRDELLTLKILLTYDAYDARYRVPDIPAAAWSALTSKNPNLEVQCVIMSRIPDMDLRIMLKPEVPLTSIMILRYSHCSQELLYSLSQKFRTKLRSFVCYANSADCGRELVQLVSICPGIDSLVFHGEIHIRQLWEIVDLRPRWRKLEFVKKYIKTEPERERFGDDDDVIVQRADGDLVQVSLLHFHGEQTEEEREEEMNKLHLKLSEKLDYSWKPLEYWQLPE